jgi:hypothetical protein
MISNVFNHRLLLFLPSLIIRPMIEGFLLSLFLYGLGIEAQVVANCPRSTEFPDSGLPIGFLALNNSNSTTLYVEASFTPEISGKGLFVRQFSLYSKGAEQLLLVPPLAGMWRITSSLLLENSTSVSNTSCTYTNYRIPPPTLSPPSGWVTVGTKVSGISNPAARPTGFQCALRYWKNQILLSNTDITIDGVGPVTVGVQSVCKGMVNDTQLELTSNLVNAFYSVPAPSNSPTVSPDPGTFIDQVGIQLSVQGNGTLFYLLSVGQDYPLTAWPPLSNWNVYKGPILLKESTLVLSRFSSPGLDPSPVQQWVYIKRRGAPAWYYYLPTGILSVILFVYLVYTGVRFVVGRSFGVVFDCGLPACAAAAEIGTFAVDAGFMASSLFQDSYISIIMQLVYVFLVIVAVVALAQRTLWAFNKRPATSLYFVPALNIFAFTGASPQVLEAIEFERALWVGCIRILHDLPTLAVAIAFTIQYPAFTNAASVAKLFWSISNILFAYQSVFLTVLQIPKMLDLCWADEEKESTGVAGLPQRADPTPASSYANVGSELTAEVDGTRNLWGDILCAAEIHILKQLKSTHDVSTRSTLLQQLRFIQKESVRTEYFSAAPSPEACRLLHIEPEVNGVGHSSDSHPTPTVPSARPNGTPTTETRTQQFPIEPFPAESQLVPVSSEVASGLHSSDPFAAPVPQATVEEIVV